MWPAKPKELPTPDLNFNHKCMILFNILIKHGFFITYVGVERYLAQAIKESGVERADIFLTTKLWPKDYGIGTTREAAMASLKRLDTDYLDLVTKKNHFRDCP